MSMLKRRGFRLKLISAIVPLFVAALILLLSAKGVLAAPPQARPFHSTGSGTETSQSAAGCQFTLAGCTVATNGSATSSHLGSGMFNSLLTIDWAAATSNGAGGFCAPASGSSTLTAANGDTLALTSTGSVCEVGATSKYASHTFTGTFTITGGTGRFSHAQGSGTEIAGDDGYGNSTYTDTGSINY